MHDPSEAIRRQGYAVLDVEPDLGAEPPRPGYAITIGLIERGRSNLLILGLPSPMSRMILATLADHGLHHEPLPLNAPLAGFFDGLEPVLRPLDESSAAAWLNRPHSLDSAPIGLGVGLSIGWSKNQQLHGWASFGPLPGTGPDSFKWSGLTRQAITPGKPNLTMPSDRPNHS